MLQLWFRCILAAEWPASGAIAFCYGRDEFYELIICISNSPYNITEISRISVLELDLAKLYARSFINRTGLRM